MDPKEMSTGGRRQRSSQEQTRREEETHLLNGEVEHLAKVTAHSQWKRQLEVMKGNVLELVHNQLSDLLDRALEEATHSMPWHLTMATAKKESREKNQLLKKKVFVPQQSLYDTLLEVEHFRTIRHIFVAVLCIFVLKQIIGDSIDEGRLVLDFDLFIVGFRQLPTAIFAWLCMFLYTLFVPYQALQIWSGCLKMTRFPNLLTATLVVLVLLCHTAMLGFFPLYILLSCDLGIASRYIVVFEQLRLLMKNYSFLRESMPPLLHARDQIGKISPPELSTYLYFLFCPTMIYRKSYPRPRGRSHVKQGQRGEGEFFGAEPHRFRSDSGGGCCNAEKGDPLQKAAPPFPVRSFPRSPRQRDPYIRWSYVIQKLVEFLAAIYFVNFLMKYSFIPTFKNMHKQPLTIKILLLSIFDSAVSGITLLVMIYYFFIHCWQNMFAEILRFADRSFYKDWWNSRSFSGFYRTWNVIVHDWLYYYIYQDVLWLVGGRARGGVMLIVFLLSAVVHEYITTLTFGIFFPVMFVLFAITGVLLNFVLSDKRKTPAWNIIIWICLILGTTTFFSLYTQEWFARAHCPLKEKTFWHLVAPRSWSCQQ